ncbi:aromatic acid exporter family protein [Radiobacillus sp. PE A8.2]|uniref:aromatic acid exporter family protein n=1 Tax=Radiobacillus sp. PE A8.2 TaxID=3380349 RepID=UPI00388FA695
MKLGARMLKTGLAVAISIYIATLLSLPSPAYAGIAAVFALQPSIYRSYQTILDQLQGNVIGVLLASLIVFTLGNDPIVVGFTAILVIGICMALKMNESTIPLAIVAVIAVMETTEMEFIQFSLMRFSALTLGIVAAFIVNLVFLPPKYETKLFQRIDKTTSDILQWLRVTTRHLSDVPALKEELTRIEDEIRQMDNTYLFYREERIYFKKNRLSKARKLILFRQLITTTKKSFEVLKACHQIEDKLDKIPTDFQTLLLQEIDKVVHSHEKLLLSTMGRIKKHDKETLRELLEPDIPRLIESLIEVYQEKQADRLMLLPLASQLMEYHQQLSHLQTLLSSYQKYHQNEHIEVRQKD